MWTSKREFTNEKYINWDSFKKEGQRYQQQIEALKNENTLLQETHTNYVTEMEQNILTLAISNKAADEKIQHQDQSFQKMNSEWEAAIKKLKKKHKQELEAWNKEVTAIENTVANKWK